MSMNIDTKSKFSYVVTIKEVKARSILRKHKKIDSWFVSRYGMNLYRGCNHNCVYCDGRAEGYYVDGEFGKDVAVKVNAIEILKKELNPHRKRVPMKRSYIMLGGGVGDSYQPVEKKHMLTRQTLELLCDRNWPVHVLTKSTLVSRDLDILSTINQHTRAIISFSFSSIDDRISSIFEPGVPPPAQRLETIALLKQHGFACGIFLLPVIPYITDSPELIEEVVKKAKAVHVDFIVFGGMTLKQGRQKDYFMRVLNAHFPELADEYEKLYTLNKWGSASPDYYRRISTIFANIAQHYRMPMRMPLSLFSDILDENDRVVVILEQIDYLLRMKGARSPYGYAAYSISQIKKPLRSLQYELTSFKGVGKATASIVKEILKTGTCELYERLVHPAIH
jgi:DNA repair photolyase